MLPRRLLVASLVAVLALSAVVRLWDLGSPGEYVFDEVYYAKDARAVLEGRVGATAKQASWEPGDVVSWPHPDAGRFAIAAGIALAGDRPLGWRLSSALAGLALLACVYPLARRLGLSQGWALAALALAAADTLSIAQSRIATLDVFVALWTGVTVLCALRYAQDGRRPLWLLLAGLAGGLAVASKWSGALALVAAALVIALPARTWRPPATAGGDVGNPTARHAGQGALTLARPLPRKARDVHLGLGARGWPHAVALAVVCLVLVPAVVYVASYVQYILAGHSLADWRELHRQMWHFNLTLSAPHSYASAAPTWILDYRPVWYSFVDKGGEYFGVVGIGNPFLWWAATTALLAAPVVALARRVTGLIGPAILVAALYFPWFAASRTSFLYYMTPVAPFLAILVAAALAAVAGRARGVRPGRARLAAVTIAGASFVCAALWQPLGDVLTFVFWDLPGRIAMGLALAAVAAGILGLIALTRLAVKRAAWDDLRWWSSCAALGATLGIAVAFLPIVLNIGIAPDRFYELIWFPSWI